MTEKKKRGRPPKPKVEEIIKRVQFRVTDDWIVLCTDPEICDKPSISELHSVIKLATVILSKITQFTTTDILSQVNKDINKNIKDRHKMMVEDWPENCVKDMYRIKEDAFKRYK